MASVEGGLTVAKDIPAEPPQELQSTAGGHGHSAPFGQDVESGEADLARINKVYRWDNKPVPNQSP